MRVVLALMTLAIGTPVLGAPVSIVVQNTSQDTIENINVFPVDVDQNIGSYTVPIAPGQAGRIDLSLAQCQPVEVLVTIKDNPAEFRPVVDLCRDPLLTVGE
ncbi:MAG: hypothetical protein P0Y65_14040 [Candidatus Devosia phytovorans]|uniref:Uncharacterized protein n=1 Tax=Candidatus Devosia phytovorans TaxID=3121372 RepID=A0AAJ6B099_9HYPH|nr:hypothetical protein [Devosia sp.]WEK03308.1 MAG: hypothetical protein P0Y65_14040 [Devosia sp.]